MRHAVCGFAFHYCSMLACVIDMPVRGGVQAEQDRVEAWRATARALFLLECPGQLMAHRTDAIFWYKQVRESNRLPNKEHRQAANIQKLFQDLVYGRDGLPALCTWVTAESPEALARLTAMVQKYDHKEREKASKELKGKAAATAAEGKAKKKSDAPLTEADLLARAKNGFSFPVNIDSAAPPGNIITTKRQVAGIRKLPPPMSDDDIVLFKAKLEQLGITEEEYWQQDA